MNYNNYFEMYMERLGSVDDCLDLIQSGDTIWSFNNCNEPATLFEHLHEIAYRLENVFVYKSRIGNYRWA